MPYYRRPYKRPRYTKKTKYSVQNRAFNILAASEATTKQEIVPPTEVEGTRKVKHIMVNLTKADGGPTAIYWAIVYVPQGTTAGNLTVAGTDSSMYEPNQYVMNCGIVDPDAGPIRFTSPLSRNLNEGDHIYLLLYHAGVDSIQCFGTVRYAITFQ